MSTPVRYAIDIVSLSKSFRRQTLTRSSYTTVKSALLAGAKRLVSFGAKDNPTTSQNFTHAIQNLTLRIPQGSSVGIIGRNGSGKSTLLKLISGIYKPDEGSIAVNGRIAALIELGAGFHPDFTGRENVHLAGVMHGLTRKEIDALMPHIVEFAELGEVIDDPVRTYSSGMFMRLGFSLAVHTNPDILIIDEVLAVGDAAFVTKCKEKIAELKRNGKTLLLVTHDLDAVERWCDEALWLHRGEPKDRGEPRRVIDHYRTFIEKGEEEELRAEQDHQVVLDSVTEPSDTQASSHQVALRWGSREVEISAVRLLRADGESHFVFHPDEGFVIEMDYFVRDTTQVSLSDIVFGVCITRSDGLIVHGTNTEIDKHAEVLSATSGTVRYALSRIGLLDGQYRLDVAVHREDGYPFDYHQGVLTFAVRWPEKQVGVYLPVREWQFPQAIERQRNAS